MVSDLLFACTVRCAYLRTQVRTSTGRGPTLRLLCCRCLRCPQRKTELHRMRRARLDHPSDLTCSNKVENADDTAVCHDVSTPFPQNAITHTHHSGHLALYGGGLHLAFCLANGVCRRSCRWRRPAELVARVDHCNDCCGGTDRPLAVSMCRGMMPSTHRPPCIPVPAEEGL